MKLGTRLLRDGIIGLSELEAALRAQVLYGGRLGTNLVELGFLDVDTVGRFLALATGAPEATRDRFERTPSDAIERFGAELAEAETAFPLGPELSSPESFAVAVLDPNDDAKRSALSEALGQPVVLYASAELRLFFYLEHHYGIERPIRYVRSQSQPREQGKIERRRVQGAPRLVIEPRRSRSARARTADPEPAARDFDSVSAELAEADSRGAIGEALISFARGRFEAMALVMIRDRTAMGWLAHPAGAVDQLSVPLSELSTLKLAYDANESYWGPPPDPDGDVETRLWSELGVQVPGRALVCPVSVRDRVVNLIAVPGPEIDNVTRGQLAGLAAAAGQAYLRLIRDFKKGG